MLVLACHLSMSSLVEQLRHITQDGTGLELLLQRAGVAGTLDSHAADLADLISNFPQPPVVVGHSFGGLILQRGFVARSFIKDVKACRELFFSPDLPDADLARHHAQLATCSPVRLMDLADVNKQVPLPPPPSFAPPAFVLGGADDKVVDVEAIQELAASYGVEPIILPNMAHDVMLEADAALLQHLEELGGEQLAQAGSTATVAVVSPNRVMVANVGDSQAFLMRKGVPVPLITPHRVYGSGPEVEGEVKRIKATGGWVYDGRVCNILAVSRAFGDWEFKVAESLVDLALKRHTSDNTSVVVIDLQGPAYWAAKGGKSAGKGLFGGWWGR
ncbi:putative thylakoid-associated phosphatase 38 [Haematococcus lacustris]|uniref:Putative thylakoid-associated phosphatase 38 n=1 Tax=Haematococcus lacustris TaxID=44745 RepID=A0A699YFH1_HAELA|nr:putative thylakoid-associated phosphatase 38 [Haematococcus lacustris]